MKYFIDCCHQSEIGVLLDFVPVHFAIDGYGLAEYDGTALYEDDYIENGFRWIDCHQEEKCIYAFERKSEKQRIVTLFNFSDKKQTYEMTVAEIEQLHMILASDEKQFGGNTAYKTREYAVKKGKVKVHKNQ